MKFLNTKKILFFVVVFSFLFFPTTTLAQQQTVNEIDLINPGPQIEIPGLDFTDEEDIKPTKDGYLVIPFLGEYLSAVYKWSVAAASIIAVLVIIVSGIQWMFPTLNITQTDQRQSINKAKKRMQGAITGLLLAVGSYTILATINPELVEFENLRIKYVERQPLPETDGEYEIKGTEFSGETGIPPQNMDELDQCLYDNFLSELNLGDPIPLETVDMWGIRSIQVNQNSSEAWKDVIRSIENSPDSSPTKGYLQYMKDFKNGEVPDLQGNKDGRGVVSQFQGGNGLGKGNTGEDVKFLRSDMHALGLGVDIMTRSNWDVKSISEAKNYCKTYQETIKNNFEEGIYNGIFEDLRSLDCENLQDVKKINTIPDEWIKIFTNNGFYWAGNGWGEQNRSDGMHFEHYGSDCIDIRRQKG